MMNNHGINNKKINFGFFALLFLFCLILLGSKSNGQSFISESDFKKKTSNGIVVVEFYAAWNDMNKVAFLGKLSDCEKYRIDISKYPAIQAKYDISVLPTVIIFNDSDEVEKFEANIMFQLEAKKDDLQEVISDLLMSKF